MNFAQLSFGVFSIKLYGLFIAISFGVAAWLYYQRLETKKLEESFFVHHFWRWAMGAIIIGRITAIIFDPTIWENYGALSLLAFWEGRISFYGALLGFLLVMYWDLVKHKQTFSKWLDVAIVPFFIALLIADFGAFFTGAIYGKETSLFWGIKYETFGVDLLNPVHPVSIYALILHFWVLHYIRLHEKKEQKFEGRLALKAGIAFFAIDFVLQLLRGDLQSYLIWILTPTQCLDLILVTGLTFKLKYIK